jgi:CubicO group peptidase (beta-lactamase class C family)
MTVNPDQFDGYISDTMHSWHCPGVSLSVIREDDVVYQRAFGFGDVEKRLPLTVDTRFALASVTKSFTAMSVALLVDEGMLEWDKPVWHYMPEFVLDDPYITRHTTVRDMLSHRTGMPRHDFAAWRLDVPRSEFIGRMRHLSFSASFREKFQYNNLMYAAAGYLVEKIAGQRWEDFIHHRIFIPLRMTGSNFDPVFSGKEHPLAEGYRIDRDESGRYNELVHMPFGKHTELSPGPAGALFSTLSDLTQWMKVHVSNGKCGEVQLVSPENLKQMHAPQIVVPVTDMAFALSGMTMMSYGMGWFIRPYPYADGTLLFHNGNVEGHSLVVGFTPESRSAVVVLTNAAACDVATILLREALDRVRGLPNKDWNKKFHMAVDPLHAAVEKAKLTSAEDRLENAPPSHSLEAYEGIYSAEGYPPFEVKLDKDQLYARTIGSLAWSDLRHYHYDVFEWHLSSWNARMKAKFLVNEAGEVASVSIPIEPAVDDIVFVRKPVVLDATTLSALAGDYATNVDGLVFNVTTKNGKLYWQESGQPFLEAMPCADRGAEIECRIRRMRAVFFKAEGRFTRLVLKAPGGTYEGNKR